MIGQLGQLIASLIRSIVDISSFSCRPELVSVNHVAESATDARVLTSARRKLGRSVPTLLVRRVLFTISKLCNDLIAPRISSDAGATALTDAIREVGHSPAVPRHVISNSLTDGQAVFVESY